MGTFTPGPWEFTHYTKFDGSPIETVEDIAEVCAESARKSDTTELWGVSMPGPNGQVICYTGNGQTSRENARVIALIPELIESLLRLSNEADSFLSLADPETHGYTNTAILRQRIGVARKVIAETEVLS